MSVAADKIAEVLALPEEDRAYLLRRLIASLENVVDDNSDAEWLEVIDRRSREIEESKVDCQPVAEVVEGIRSSLDARRHSS